MKWTIELEPKVELKQYKDVTVEVEETPLSDAMVDQRIESLRMRNAVMETVADAELKESDFVTVDLDVTNDKGEPLPHLSRKDWQIRFPERARPQARRGDQGQEGRASATATDRRTSPRTAAARK